MFELICLIGILILGGALLIGLLKLIVGLALLPFKLTFWFVKGVVVLVILVPLAVIGLGLVSVGVPILLFVLLLPLFLGVLALCFLVRLIF
ncbi:MAG: hypothetical protein GTO51_05685 [Candidatus Latescibacteria bacterium]|nr:hypothetical protein [Candidatus Latescibacterota bacterium]NIM21214.1 hypothetical protein [Candidatus Latescibacterota bacterium]NIM65468.1 hypothetical protein [Candidatus Latescibacterota bacterium]NIO01846.1 hypothetical protein [Candidatus Latescibacterota bacterium]NIO28496.1 hypothetical protein [Candidatus Latescibacterota bacterium]